jgi:hypothetical protein
MPPEWVWPGLYRSEGGSQPANFAWFPTLQVIAQFIFIPFMTTGAGAELLGSWFGTGTGVGLYPDGRHWPGSHAAGHAIAPLSRIISKISHPIAGSRLKNFGWMVNRRQGGNGDRGNISPAGNLQCHGSKNIVQVFSGEPWCSGLRQQIPKNVIAGAIALTLSSPSMKRAIG